VFLTEVKPHREGKTDSEEMTLQNQIYKTSKEGEHQRESNHSIIWQVPNPNLKMHTHTHTNTMKVGWRIKVNTKREIDIVPKS
jgi:hypothetical protein